MYILSSWGASFTYALMGLKATLVTFVPRFLFAVIVFIIGWVIGAVLGKAVEQLISALKVDKVLASAGADSMMERAGIRLNSGAFVGGIVKWGIIILFLIASLGLLQLTAVTDFLTTNVLGYLVNVIIAILVLVIATVVADFMGKLVTASAKASNVRSANFLGTLTRYAIWIFALIMAFGELGIAAAYMQILFTGLIAMLAIAGGLAFGLGGKEWAAGVLARLSERTKSSSM